jgi:hypothetical protein
MGVTVKHLGNGCPSAAQMFGVQYFWIYSIDRLARSICNDLLERLGELNAILMAGNVSDIGNAGAVLDLK